MILLPLFFVNIPTNAEVIFNAIMLVAAFESIPTDDIYASFFTVDEGRPLNSNFETLGFEHHLLLNNFGSLGFILVFIIFPSYPLYYIMKRF